MFSVKSYRMILTSSSSSTLNELTTEQQMEVKFTAPDRYYVTSTDIDWTGSRTRKFIIIGNKQYIYDGEPPIGGYDIIEVASSFFLKKDAVLQYLNMFINTASDVQILAEENISGVDCYHYTGTEDKELQMGERSSIMHIDAGLWIGKDDHLIHRWQIDMQMPDGLNETETDTSCIIIEYTDINEPISIEPPIDENGDLLRGWKVTSNSQPEF